MAHFDQEIAEQQAIDAAIAQNWDTAIVLNNAIIKHQRKNLGAHLRLGFAYLQLKNLKKAKEFYKKALTIQPKNHIALSNLQRIRAVEGKTASHFKNESTHLNPSLFLEQPGRTKSVALVKLGQKKDIATVTLGQELLLRKKNRGVEARTKSGVYIGCLPDDLSKRLLTFIRAKSDYAAYVQEATLTRIVIFLKELTKGPRVRHLTSFPTNIRSGLDELEALTKNDNADENTEQEQELGAIQSAQEDDDTEDDDKDELEKMAEDLPERDDDDPIIGISHDEEDDDTD